MTNILLCDQLEKRLNFGRVKDVRVCSTMIEVENGLATLSMELEQSDRLEIWTSGSTTTFQVTADSDTKFFRFQMPEQSFRRHLMYTHHQETSQANPRPASLKIPRPCTRILTQESLQALCVSIQGRRIGDSLINVGRKTGPFFCFQLILMKIFSFQLVA